MSLDINPNAKSSTQIDAALREASFAAGGDGDTFRRASKGHSFEFSASRSAASDLAVLAQELADALGCRVKVAGRSDDGDFILGHLDADNWDVDEAGVARPFKDGSFELEGGVEAVPAGFAWGPAELAESKARAEASRPEPAAQAQALAPSPSEGEPGGASDALAAAGPDPGLAASEPDREPARFRGKASAPEGPTQVSDPALGRIDTSAEMRLAMALRESGVDLFRLRLALDRLAR